MEWNQILLLYYEQWNKFYPFPCKIKFEVYWDTKFDSYAILQLSVQQGLGSAKGAIGFYLFL